MGRDFYESDPAARALFDLTSERCGRDLRAAGLRGAGGVSRRKPRGAGERVPRLDAGVARSRAARACEPSATAGYSLGNYAAMVAAGAISYEEALDVLVAVWRETERLGIRGGDGRRRRRAPGSRRSGVRGAARPRPPGLDRQRQRVDAVRPDRVGRRAWRRLWRPSGPGRSRCFPLSMSWPIHSELMRPVAEAIAPMIASLRTIRDPDVPVLRPGGPRGPGRGGGPPTARHGVLFPDALEGHVRSHDGGGASSLSRGRAPATCCPRWCGGSTVPPAPSRRAPSRRSERPWI